VDELRRPSPIKSKSRTKLGLQWTPSNSDQAYRTGLPKVGTGCVGSVCSCWKSRSLDELDHPSDQISNGVLSRSANETEDKA